MNSLKKLARSTLRLLVSGTNAKLCQAYLASSASSKSIHFLPMQTIRPRGRGEDMGQVGTETELMECETDSTDLDRYNLSP